MKQFPFMIYSNNSGNEPIGYITSVNKTFEYFTCKNKDDWPSGEFIFIETNIKKHVKIFCPKIKKFMSFKNDILLTSNDSSSSIFDLSKKSNETGFVYLYCVDMKQYVYINSNNILNTKEDGSTILLKENYIN